MTQRRHGPFDSAALHRAAAADAARCDRGQCPPQGDIDHWKWPTLGRHASLPVGSKFKDDSNDQRLQAFLASLGDSRMKTKWEDANVAYYQEHGIEPTVLPPALDHRPAEQRKQQTQW